jgi:hypothetical protein
MSEPLLGGVRRQRCADALDLGRFRYGHETQRGTSVSRLEMPRPLFVMVFNHVAGGHVELRNHNAPPGLTWALKPPLCD